MKTYKVVFDGHIEPYDLAKMISNEYGRSAALINSKDDRFGNTKATIEFDSTVPYEVIELMTDGNVIVQRLVLEDEAAKENVLKESLQSDVNELAQMLSDFIRKSDRGEFLSATIYAYMEAKNFSFEDAVNELSDSLQNFNEEAFNLYIGR